MKRTSAILGRRSGFTQVEILVTIAIILLLVSLLLPVMGRTREVARGSQCKDNLHNLLIAAHNYQSNYGSLPAGVLSSWRPIRSQPGGDGLSWLVRLLPYVEQQPLYSQMDLSQPVDGQRNREARISVYLCPAGPEDGPAMLGGSNYAGCHHHVEAPINADNHGSFLLGRGLMAVDFADGLSHTLWIGEKEIPADDRGWMSGSRATLRNTGTPFARCVHATSRQQPESTADPLAVGGLASAHAYGVHVGMGDSAARLLSFDIDLQVLQRLADRADGELIPASDLNRRPTTVADSHRTSTP